jgi:hypothetical protein
VRGVLPASLALLAVACGSAPRTEIPLYEARRTADAPVVDGDLDDPAWQQAARTERFVNTRTGAAARPRTEARITWDDERLYIGFDVADTFLRATLEGRDAHLWTEDCVEVMVDPDGDGLEYFEIQLSPTHQVFDTRYRSRRVPQPFGITSWDSRLEGRASVDGTVNDDASDRGYEAELAIPFAALGVARPEEGDEWRVALYVLDARREGQGGVGWSPPLVGDFHVPARFGRVRFLAE